MEVTLGVAAGVVGEACRGCYRLKVNRLVAELNGRLVAIRWCEECDYVEKQIHAVP